MDSSDLQTRIGQLAAGVSKLKLLAGQNISLSQQEEGLTVSASAPAFSERFKRWLLQVNDSLGKPEIVAGRGIIIERGPDSITISAEKQAQSAGSKSMTSAAADHPFKCEIQADGSALVKGWNETAKRYFRNYVTLGLTRLEIAEKTFSAISADSWIYLEASVSGGSYSAELKSATTLPAGENGKYIVAIAFVKTKDGKASEAFQMQHGPIEGSGRIF